MATRYGYQTFQWLLKRGWIEALDYTNLAEENLVFGDPRVIDPVTGDERSVYEAVSLHHQRGGDFPEFLKGVL
jgi:hypothetical protein